MANRRHTSFGSVAALALGAVLVAPGALAAGKPMLVAEQAFEATSADVRLPERVGISIGLPGCSKQCPASVIVTEQTRYFIGKREVTLAELRAKLAGRAVAFTLFYDPKTNAVTRIKTS